MRLISTLHRGSAAPSMAFAAIGALITLLYGLGALGAAQQSAVDVLGTATLLAIPGGIILNRPARRAPWVLVAVALLFFLVDLGLREEHGPGHGIPAQNLLSNVIALPAYLLTAVAVTMLAHKPGVRDRGNLDVILDGLMAMMATLTLAWVYLINPLLSDGGLPLPNRVLLASFPAIDVYLVMLAFRVGFESRLVVRRQVASCLRRS